MLSCQYCGDVDEDYDEESLATHYASPKHQCNKILYFYNRHKDQFKRNREGIEIMTSVPEKDINDVSQFKILIEAKPNESVKFNFEIKNKSKHDVIIVGIGLAHPQSHFIMDDQGWEFGDSKTLALATNTNFDVSVTAQLSDIGQIEMPIMFTFQRITDDKTFIFAREIGLLVTNEKLPGVKTKNPFTNVIWMKSAISFPCVVRDKYVPNFNVVPYTFKKLFTDGSDPLTFDSTTRVSEDFKAKCLQDSIQTKAILNEGVTVSNYDLFWCHVLWWEEVVMRINMKKYNMGSVLLEKKEKSYFLEVPGLAEKRPSLLRGDRVFIRKVGEEEIAYEGSIFEIEDNYIEISGVDKVFESIYKAEMLFDVRFILGRRNLERMHLAVAKLPSSTHLTKVFPEPNKKIPKLIEIDRFYNASIKENPEQATAVQHIISGTSGRAPYMVFGPPGTGKTVTIVEAIIQLVLRNPRNKIMVCTDSNMAADHVACSILKYRHLFTQRNKSNFMIRLNSKNRVWEIMPQVLHSYSNGYSYETFRSMKNKLLATYSIIICTLQHSAKYGICRADFEDKLNITHLFIDEAAQSHEPACLIPITGFLEKKGQLVLAGDPKQLGPICFAKKLRETGLGVSMMERLKSLYDIYDNDRNYITMLKKNFRSHPDIIALPNQLFYNDLLEAIEPAAGFDAISSTRVLEEFNEGGAAVVFHGVNSKDQRIGSSPSFFNKIEIEMIQRYVKALICVHKVEQTDIGVIAPYKRQVQKIKQWLIGQQYFDIEVGTVEAFQGKEKRIILVTTVRANCRLLDYDAKYGLGFLVDDKRFNVTLTRAKAKAIFIGNPACLSRDIKWRLFMRQCKNLNSYLGTETEQLERNLELLTEITQNRFKKFRITQHLKEEMDETKKVEEAKKKTKFISRAFMD